jgi:hypothetical protein
MEDGSAALSSILAAQKPLLAGDLQNLLEGRLHLPGLSSAHFLVSFECS